MDNLSLDISVVIPVFNEERSLRELSTRLVDTLEKMEHSFELVFVDDGSTDGSLEVLRELRTEDTRIRVVCLSRNFGQSPALYAGFSVVRGRYIGMIDADLQNYPEDFPKLIEKLEEGYDIVSGWRADRYDNYFRHLSSRFLNYFLAKITKVPLQDCGCSLKAFRREVVDRMSQLSHRSRYLPVDITWLGGKMCEVRVQHTKRTQGVSKYGLMRLMRTGFDLLTSITAVPLQIIGLLGWVFAMVGFAMGIRVVYVRVFYGDPVGMGAVVAIAFVLTGIQLAAIGLMCEYISRIFIEVQRKPYYIIKEELG